MICVQNLWRWQSGLQSDGSPLQTIYAHSTCTKKRMGGATTNLDPSTFSEDD
jgi:hypothetical protein